MNPELEESFVCTQSLTGSRGLTSMEFGLAVAAKHHAGFVVRSCGNVRRKLLSSSSLLTGALDSSFPMGVLGLPKLFLFPGVLSLGESLGEPRD